MTKDKFNKLLNDLEFAFVNKIPNSGASYAIGFALNTINDVDDLTRKLSDNRILELAGNFHGNLEYKGKEDIPVHAAWSYICKLYLYSRHVYCQTCQYDKSYNIHHSRYSQGYELERYTDFTLLCRGCHSRIHTQKYDKKPSRPLRDFFRR